MDQDLIDASLMNEVGMDHFGTIVKREIGPPLVEALLRAFSPVSGG